MLWRLLWGAFLSGTLTGCFSPYMTQPGRTGIEQQVTSAAIQACVAQLDTTAIDRRFQYRLTVSTLADVDAEWVRACVQERLFRDGVRVTDGVAAGHIEVAVAFAGADYESTLIGIPLFLPGTPIAFGDISLYKSNTQTGRARMSLQVWIDSRLAMVTPEVQDSRYFKNESFLTVIGSFISTDLPGFREPGDEQEDE
ncbi:MAG: hypothetical protein RL885_02840 [Planctomycetota bacterium]